MFPKRMKGGEAPRRPALDSTKKLDADQLETSHSKLFPPDWPRPDAGPIFVIYLPGICQTRGEYKRADIPIAEHKPRDKTVQQQNERNV